MSSARNYLHTIATSPDAGILVWLDKRKSPRVAYCALLPVNPNLAANATKDMEFESVETRDLSQTGCSFFCSQAPDEPTLIVQLGEPPTPLFMVARIVRCEKDYDDPQRRFIVGCEFVGQLKE